MTSPYDVAHQLRVQAAMTDQAHAMTRQATALEAQVEIAKKQTAIAESQEVGARRAQKQAYVLAVASLGVTFGSLIVAVLAVVLNRG